MTNLEVFINRLKKLNITIELSSNYPWIYLDKVNGNSVKEKYYSDYKFTIAFSPIRQNQKLRFTDLSEIFKVIRKYR
jgi:hypothetical protein